jgi:uncharacterized protein (TIGR03086 family)
VTGLGADDVAMDADTTSPNDPTDLAADDPRRALAGAVATLRSVMEQVRPDQWDAPTPCEAMTVAELQEHLVMVVRRIACAGRGEPLERWPMDAADVAPGDWLDAVTAAAHDVQAAWPDRVLGEERQLPWGTFTGSQVAAVYTNEVVVHTWDLARATGQSPTWDDAVLSVAWAAIRSQLPEPERAPMWDQARQYLPEGEVWEDPFADAVAVPDDAPLIDRLVAWNGRDPSA